MAQKDVEIELKFPLNNSSEVIKFLSKNAELKARDVLQKDIYFIPAHRDFLNVKYPFEWLRLRESPKGASFNYKHFHPENVEKTDYCDEYETNIETPESVKKILKSLDFKEAVVVEKKRSAWVFEKTEISIDDVKELGFFIEIEALEHLSDAAFTKKYLYDVLKKIKADVGKEDLRGYPFRILEKNHHA
ncbi:MAG: class IV adenylate cyclase [Nanoarchaeota archaeon]|nr:class IV adenylate cyclase [Nanoarchaeota archaeon]